MTLQQIGLKHKTDKATHHLYCDFYEAELKGKQINSILEIGVKDGASLRMWKEFYPHARVVGVDINKPFHIEGCEVIQADASKPLALSYTDKFDLIIDDGSHLTSHQLQSYLFSKHAFNVAYIVEDLHTSFLYEYIDTPQTAFDWFKQNTNIKIYQRDKSIFHDSVTGIIFK